MVPTIGLSKVDANSIAIRLDGRIAGHATRMHIQGWQARVNGIDATIYAITLDDLRSQITKKLAEQEPGTVAGGKMAKLFAGYIKGTDPFTGGAA